MFISGWRSSGSYLQRWSIIAGKFLSFPDCLQHIKLHLAICYAHIGVESAGMIDIFQFVGMIRCIKRPAIPELYYRNTLYVFSFFSRLLQGNDLAFKIAYLFLCADPLKGKTACTIYRTSFVLDQKPYCHPVKMRIIQINNGECYLKHSPL